MLHQIAASEAAYKQLAEVGAQEGERKFHKLLDAIPAGAYTCDPHGLITYFNRHAVQLWGRAPRLNDPEDRFCGSFRLYSCDGSPIRHDQCGMALALHSGQGYNGQEILVERPDGNRLAVLAYANPIHDDTKKLLGAVNVLVDISQRKQREETLRESRDTAVASNRAKDHFLARLSHELRTPLSPVMMSIAAMENNPNLPEEFREEVSMIRRNIDLEVTLIDDLLDVSRAIHGKLRLQMRPLCVHPKLRHVIRNCQSEISGKRLTLHAALDATNDRVNADPARLQQAFWNLLRNAMKFTPEGGEIFVRTWNAENGDLCIEMRDTGIGITAEALPCIFEAFEQGETWTTQQLGGLGLGLSITKAIMKLHGGTIVAASDGKNQGAKFTLRLHSISPSAVHEAAALPSGMDNTASTRIRVLIVEDHHDTALMMSKLLKSAGYEVGTAGSVAAALQLADAEPFDILVSDIGLPDASGYDLMAQLKGRHNMKGIALSGYGMDEDVRRSHAAGFVEHLVKPVNLTQLQAAIQCLVSG